MPSLFDVRELDEMIVDFIWEEQGCKGSLIAAQVEIVLLASELEVKLGDVLDRLVYEKRIREIEYELPSMEYRTKSFYLPGTTTIQVRD